MNVTILNERKVFDGFFKIIEGEIRHERFDGSEQTIKRLCFDRGDAVAAVVYDRDTDALLFTEQFRYSAFKRSGASTILEIMAGMVASDESHQDCLLREMDEELGVSPSKLRYIGSYFLSPGGSSERIHIYFVEVGERIGNGGGLAEEKEDIRVVLMPVRDVEKKLSNGGFNDAKTQLGLLMSRELWNK